jgi:hypothetical protein
MKKRDFLKGAATAGVLASTGTVLADNRLFGTPASIAPYNPGIANKLRLSFARADLPTPVWDDMLAFTTGLDTLATSPDARAQFSSSPRAYFEAIGAKLPEQFETSPEVAMARLIADGGARTAATNGDYVGFLQKLRDFGLPTVPDAQGLTARVTDLLRRDITVYEKIRDSINRSAVTENQETTWAALEGATPEINKGSDVYTFAYASIFIYVDVAAVLISISAAVVGAIAFAVVEKPLKSGAFGTVSRLDPRMLEGAQTATSAARLLGNKDFEIQVALDVVHREIESIIAAAETVGIVTSPQQRDSLILAGKEAAGRVFGLAA